MNIISHIVLSTMAFLGLILGAHAPEIKPHIAESVQIPVAVIEAKNEVKVAVKETPIVVPEIVQPVVIEPIVQSTSELPLVNPNQYPDLNGPNGTQTQVQVVQHDDNILPDGSVRVCYSTYWGMCGCGGICTPK